MKATGELKVGDIAYVLYDGNDSELTGHEDALHGFSTGSLVEIEEDRGRNYACIGIDKTGDLDTWYLTDFGLLKIGKI